MLDLNGIKLNICLYWKPSDTHSIKKQQLQSPSADFSQTSVQISFIVYIYARRAFNLSADITYNTKSRV